MIRYLYEAKESSSHNYTSMALYQKNVSGQLFGCFIKGKPYICFTNLKGQLKIAGFFSMQAEVPRKKKINFKKIGIGYFELEFEKQTAAKFLKYIKKI